jgi:xanthosine utilization system XapX-like protein
MFPDVLTPAYAIGWSLLWAFVASLLVFVVFQLTGRTGSDDAIALGCLVWVLLLIVCGVLGMLRGDFVPVAVPLAAFGPAAVVVWRRSSSSPHGEVTGESP